MWSAKPQNARTRIVCISDTHNQTPQLPKGDVLIHAGDLTNQGSYSELKKTVAWLEKADYEAKIVVAGNHDITLDSDFYSEHWAYFHNQNRQNVEDCIALLRDSPSITYLQHQPCDVKLTSPTGPQTHFKLFGTPYSPAHGLWAFGYKETEATDLWDQVPIDTDILVTHTPPKGHCDQMVTKNGRAGCEHLRRRLWQVRPRLHICGHLHEGRGAEVVRWKDVSNCPFMEDGAEYWDDPGAGEGNKKQSILSLIPGGGRTGWLPAPPASSNLKASQQKRSSKGIVSFSGVQSKPPTASEVESLQDMDSYRSSLDAHTIHRHLRKTAVINELAARSADDTSAGADEESVFLPDEGFVHRNQRKTTCVVNAAIMKNSFGGPKRLNKPIVVDIDLPVWSDRG